MMIKKIEGSFQEDSSTDSSTESSTVSLGVFEQVKWERDVALKQLEELGYGLGEKIRTDEDCISREAAIEIIENWLSCDGYNEAERHIMRAVQGILHDLPSVKPNVDVDALINKIDDDLSWCLIDGLGNRNDLYKRLVRIIKDFFGEVSE